MVIACCDGLLLAHSANFIELTFMVVKIFLVKLSAAPGGNCPCPLTLVTPLLILLRHK